MIVILLSKLLIYRIRAGGMEAGTGQVDDLATLYQLNEQNLLHELELRYKKEKIYVSWPCVIL